MGTVKSARRLKNLTKNFETRLLVSGLVFNKMRVDKGRQDLRNYKLPIAIFGANIGEVKYDHVIGKSSYQVHRYSRSVRYALWENDHLILKTNKSCNFITFALCSD